MILKTPQDIPADWQKFKAKKKTKVTFRPSNGIEKFKVSWQDSELVSDPDKDFIVNSGGKEYPCKKDIFFETYQPSKNDFSFWEKKELSILVAVPEGITVSIETLEGDVQPVTYPDFVVIGKQNELYANKKEWVDQNLQLMNYES